MARKVAAGLLRQINERRVLELIQRRGPSSRAAVMRASGMSAPTVSKAAASLIEHGLLEEHGQHEPAIGRPSKLLRLAASSANLLGIVIDAPACWIGVAGLDGKLHSERSASFGLPMTYEQLLDTLEKSALALMKSHPGTYRGVGVCAPGLVNSQLQAIVFSPNLHLLDGQRPARDLAARLGLDCLLVQESHALCLGERMYGEAKGLDNFAMLDVSTGLGLGVMSGGQLLTGQSGLAGEFGHITVDARGVQCGCGNHGCLETVATDSALVRLLGARDQRVRNIDDAIRLALSGELDASLEIDETCEYLAIATAAVINTFNPSTLFLHGRIFELQDDLFARVVARAGKRSLRPSFADCQVLQARGSKRQGAVASVIHNLTSAWAPAFA